MSFARFSNTSSVYVYDDVNGSIACCGCILGDQWEFHSVPEIIEHMRAHETAGHKVPAHLFDPDTYDGCTFTPMCHVFLCREDEGHPGEHTPITGRDAERMNAIRASQLTPEAGS